MNTKQSVIVENTLTRLACGRISDDRILLLMDILQGNITVKIFIC